MAIAVKSFIVHEGKLLLLKRSSTEPHKPGEWDIPGGRLDNGEDVHAGTMREAKEETGLEIKVLRPLDAHSFTRDDGQHITMIIFLCEPKTTEIKLSSEHTEFTWQEITTNKNSLPSWLGEAINNYLN